MTKIKDKKTFKIWLNEDNNRENLRKIAIPITALPADDDWINDNGWDEIYDLIYNKKQ